MNEALVTSGGQPRILYIEEDPARRAQVRQILEGHGFQVAEAPDARAGLDLAMRAPPDLILVDIDLPGLDGYEAATKLRAHHELDRVPIVVLSARGDRNLSLSVGCDGYIQTPIDAQRFPEQLSEFLHGKRERLLGAEERRYLREYSQALVDRLEATVRELTAANALLVAADRARSDFLRNLSHELATPLTPLAGYLKILRSGKLGALSEQQIKVVDAMMQSSERLARTIDNLVDFASLVTGAYQVRLAPFDPAAMAQSALLELRPKARGKRVHAELVEEGPARPLVGDERKLKQALSNLVDNAIKFSPHGGEVLLELDRRGPSTVFAIYDQGEGMGEEDQRRAFEPFVHAEGGEDRAPGAGLGLPVAKRIVEAHQGQIWLESPPKTQVRSPHHFAGTKAAFEVPPLDAE